MPVADVRFGPGAPRFTHLPQSGSGPPKKGTHTGMLSYLHKVKDGRNVYFFANSTDESVDQEITLRGKLRLRRWDPQTGEIAMLKTTEFVEDGQSFTKAKLELDPVKSVFFVEPPAE